MQNKKPKTYQLNISSRGEGKTLVLIHGVAGSLHIWDPVVDALSADYKVVRMDSLGYGYSPKPRISYTPQSHTDAIRSTLIQNGLKPPYTLVGLSMGVNLALEYVARWPDEVEDFIGIGFPYYSTKKAALHGLHNDIWTRLTIEHPIVAQLFIPPVWWLGLHNIIPTGSFTKIYTPLMSHETLLAPYYVFKSSLINCMLNNQQTSLLATIGDKKRLFIHGSEDKWAQPTDVSDAIAPYKKSTLQVISDTGHNVVVLNPEKTVELITEYLVKKEK